MKRALGAAAGAVLGLVSTIGPTMAQGVSTPVATQENVRHLKTVAGTTGGHVVVEGNRLYMGNYGTGLSAYDITDPRNPAKIGQYLPGPSGSGPGDADTGVRADAPPDAAVWDGKHVVSLGGTFRGANRVQTEFIDFTNPASPTLLYRFGGSVSGGGTHGESHNGDIVDARKLWLPSGGSGNDGLRIYDMSPLLQNPPAAPIRLGAWNPQTLWQNSRYRMHYGKQPGGSFDHTHDIEVYTDREILLPEWEWVDSNEDGTPDPTRGKRDIALMATALGQSNAGGAVYVVDITNPRLPVVISKWANSGGNAIAYLHEVQFLDGDPNTMVVTDEDFAGCEEGRVYTVRTTDDLVTNTKLAEWTIGGGYADSPACLGAHVISSHDRHVFMGAYVAGLQILDLRDPAAPKRAGRYIAEGMNSWGALYNKGVIYTGDFGGRGLDVFEFIKDPVAKSFLEAGNPNSRPNPVNDTLPVSVYGISDTLAYCEPGGAADGIDGMWLTVPEDKRDGNATIRALGSGAPGTYDVDVWFVSEGCGEYIEPALMNDGGDESGKIPAGTEFAVVDLYTGGPQWVYAQIT
ncbi:MAG TPA: hypothetical protein VEA19_03925 [Actinomycetota bacterium]|nr:hypothetical protein [Actinomycetota bacterium]